MVDILASALDTAVKRIFAIVDKALSPRAVDKNVVTAKLDQHLKFISSWSAQIQHHGMATPLWTDESTVALDLAFGARRFRPHKSQVASFHEDALLNDVKHYVMLGDPGSGKTTTIKRLARRLLYLPPTSSADIFQFPIVITVRDLVITRNLYATIATALGIIIETKYRMHDDGELLSSPRTTLMVENPQEPEDRQRLIRVKLPHDVLSLIGDQLTSEFISNFFDTTGAVLLVDGLDEYPWAHREELEKQLSELSHLLQRAKIIVSCRTGDYISSIGGFSLVEILPLSQRDIHAIASRWLANSDEFLRELSNRSYQELADRPLFLVNLMLIYQMGGYLPDKSVDVYRRMLTLILQEWDQRRRIHRSSKYARFLPERKTAFLCELAWELTYDRQIKTFSEEILEGIYNKIAHNHDLPIGEATSVVQEIESHTGIIVVAGYQTYEFSHLTLQEYLAANFIIHQPYIRNVQSLFLANPAPFAVAVALAFDPGRWFSNIVLQHLMQDPGTLATGRIGSFLARILTENVEFKEGELLGMALAWLQTTRPTQGDDAPIATLIARPQCFASIAKALRNFTRIDHATEKGTVEYRLVDNRQFELPVPSSVRLPKDLADRILAFNTKQGFREKAKGP